jgi:hypothetical protein
MRAKMRQRLQTTQEQLAELRAIDGSIQVKKGKPLSFRWQLVQRPVALNPQHLTLNPEP